MSFSVAYSIADQKRVFVYSEFIKKRVLDGVGIVCSGKKNEEQKGVREYLLIQENNVSVFQRSGK